jgi:hypothetical protein
VREQIGLDGCGLLHRSQATFLVSATEQPPRAARHLRVHDVVDPGARHHGPHVLGILRQHLVERPAGLPVLVPSRLAAERPELEPDVVQIELAQEEQRLFVSGFDLEASARDRLRPPRLGHEGGQQRGACGAPAERLVLIR